MYYKKGNLVYCGDSDCIGILIIKFGIVCIYIFLDEGWEVILFWFDDGDVCILLVFCILKIIIFDVYVDVEMDCDII